MSVQLTEEMRQALEAHPDLPLRFIDEKTNTSYVVLRADVYERVRSLFEKSPLSREEQLYLLQQAGKRAGWDDPEMDVYNELDPRNK